MGDLKVSETFQDAVYITVTATGAPSLLLNPTCSWVRISNNTRTAGTVQEVGSGWYRVTDFTPAQAGAFVTEWGAPAGNTIYGNYKLFKTGGGRTEDIFADTQYIYSTAIGGAPVANSIAARIDAAISTRLAAASYTAERGTDNAALAATALSTVTWTAVRAGYLDNINQVGLLQVTAARAGYLDNINNASLASIALTGALVNAQVKGQDNIDFGALQKTSLGTAVKTDVGSYAGQANLTTLLAALGIPDVAAKPLYTCLITDRLDHGTYGLSALETLVDGVEGDLTLVKTETDQLPNWVFNVPYAIDPVSETVADVAETALTACTFTPVWRTGATVVRAILHAYLTASAQAAGGHKIGLTLQYSRDGGAYADLIDLTAVPPMAIPDLDESMGQFAIAIDVTAEFTTSNVVYGFKWLVDSDNAGDVHYTSNFEVVITQSM